MPKGERSFRQTRRFSAAILCVLQGKATPYGGKRSALWACCPFFKQGLVIGNLSEKPLKEIINGEVVKTMRQMNEDGSILNYSICKNCDQLHDRSDVLIYSSDKNMRVRKHSMLIEERVYED